MKTIKRIHKDINYKPVLMTGVLILCVLLLSIGFSSLSTNLNASSSAIVRLVKDIRVTGAVLETTSSSGASNWSEYDVNNLIASVNLPNSSSTVSYDVEVTNISNVEMGILTVTGLPENLTYSISNYNLKDTLCDDTNSTQCKLGSTTTLHVTVGYKNNGFDSSNTTYRFNMNFDFKEVYNITYRGFNNTSSLPSTILDGETKNITFNSNTGIPANVSVSNATGSYSSPNLTLSSAEGAVTVTRYFSITYHDFTGDTSGLISSVSPDGATINFNSTTGIPDAVMVSGATFRYNPTTHVLTLSNVASNVSVTMAVDGDVEITSVTRYAISNVVENSNPQITNNGQGIAFDLGVTANQINYNDEFYVTYAVVVTNDSVYEQKVLASNFTPSIVGSGTPPVVSYNITDANGNSAVNATIPPKTSETYYLTIVVEPQEQGSWGVEGETEVNTAPTGAVTGSISGSNQGDLTGSNIRTHFVASINNTFEEAKTFTIRIDDSKFKVVDSSGNDIQSMTIAANTTNTYDFYIENLNENHFIVTPYPLNINIFYDGDDTSIGIVELAVDRDPNLVDLEAPTISDLTATITSAQKEILVSWKGNDNGTIKNFVVETYSSDANGNGTRIKQETVAGSTNGTVVNYTATVPTDDAYYFFKVYGIDQDENSASTAEITGCQETSGHCSKSSNQKYKWNFVVTLSLNNATSSKGTTVTNGTRRTVTFNAPYDSNIDTVLSGAGNDYNAPSSISSATITYANGTTEDLPSGNSSQTAYNYNTNSHALNVYHITGDVNISASGSSTCLAEGTKILMADGTYKKIEDIKYDDLLAVWNYDTGELTYEYPLWIETEQVANQKIRVTFTNGVYIDFVGNHAIYNTDINMFVHVLDDPNFKVGTHVAMLQDGKLVNTTVKSIKIINGKVKYYFVGSTTYYNVFANGILTSDHTLMISNLYGFEDNAIWPKEKDLILQDRNNLLDYSYFEDVIPYYMYKGFRVREAGYLVNNNFIALDEFKRYIITFVMNPLTLKNPITIKNNRYWMVTTSEDIVNNQNKSSYLRKEGSIYTLPKSNKDNFIGWLNTADNIMYKPGDKVVVAHGLYFKALYDNNSSSNYKSEYEKRFIYNQDKYFNGIE